MCAELRPRPGHCHHEHIPPAAVRLKSHRISDATSSSRMSSGPFASTWAAGPFRQSTRPSSESIRAASGILRIDRPNQRHGWNFADAARCRRNADNNRCADSMIAFPAIKIGKNYEFHRIHTDGDHTKHTHTHLQERRRITIELILRLWFSVVCLFFVIIARRFRRWTIVGCTQHMFEIFNIWNAQLWTKWNEKNSLNRIRLGYVPYKYAFQHTVCASKRLRFCERSRNVLNIILIRFSRRINTNNAN